MKTLLHPTFSNAVLILLTAIGIIFAQPFFTRVENKHTRDLCGKIILITGSNTGLGFAMAQEMLSSADSALLQQNKDARNLEP
jgi:multisubunit Na+/H+ antiporter MnhG subunit